MSEAHGPVQGRIPSVESVENSIAAQVASTPESIRVRSIAVSAGDYRVAAMREVHRMLSQNQGNPLKAAEAGLERLAESSTITSQDHKRLAQICQQVFAVQNGDETPEAAFARVRVIYDGMLTNPATSPVALAIASIASSGSPPAVPGDSGLPRAVVARMSHSDKVDTGIVGGAIGGAVIGGAIGGAGGAIIGGVIGGIAAGIGTACAT
jgi:hypothetical protein